MSVDQKSIDQMSVDQMSFDQMTCNLPFCQQICKVSRSNCNRPPPIVIYKNKHFQHLLQSRKHNLPQKPVLNVYYKDETKFTSPVAQATNGTVHTRHLCISILV
jgi:hypothetical protein